MDGELKVVVEEQAGFRGYPPVDQLYVLPEIIQRQKRRKKAWYCALLDIKRAYDVVWRCVVGEVVDVWSAFGGQRVVSLWRTNGEWCDVDVRQAMSPNLFSLFINGITEISEGNCLGG